MLQALFTERFNLVAHRETRELPIYVLTVDKGGPKLAPTADPANNSTSTGRGSLKGKAMKTAAFAKELSNSLGQSVVDRTGLTGEYDITLQWDPEPVSGTAPETAKLSEHPDLFTGIRQQLGLKLEARKGPVEVLVVDQAERPSAN
jgi:uncharacterized protein (TIGR03435 family)